MSRTAAATAAIQAHAAIRAIDDPVRLARAARIVRLALARNRLTLDDLTDITPTVGAPARSAASRRAPR